MKDKVVLSYMLLQAACTVLRHMYEPDNHQPKSA